MLEAIRKNFFGNEGNGLPPLYSYTQKSVLRENQKTTSIERKTSEKKIEK